MTLSGLLFWSIFQTIIWFVNNLGQLNALESCEQSPKSSNLCTFHKWLEFLCLAIMVVSLSLIIVALNWLNPAKLKQKLWIKFFTSLSILWMACCVVNLIYVEWIFKILWQNSYKIRSCDDNLVYQDTQPKHWPLLQTIAQLEDYWFILVYGIFYVLVPFIMNLNGYNMNGYKHILQDLICLNLLISCCLMEPWLLTWRFDVITASPSKTMFGTQYCGNNLLIFNCISYLITCFKLRKLRKLSSIDNNDNTNNNTKINNGTDEQQQHFTIVYNQAENVRACGNKNDANVAIETLNQGKYVGYDVKSSISTGPTAPSLPGSLKYSINNGFVNQRNCNTKTKRKNNQEKQPELTMPIVPEIDLRVNNGNNNKESDNVTIGNETLSIASDTGNTYTNTGSTITDDSKSSAIASTTSTASIKSMTTTRTTVTDETLAAMIIGNPSKEKSVNYDTTQITDNADNANPKNENENENWGNQNYNVKLNNVDDGESVGGIGNVDSHHTIGNESKNESYDHDYKSCVFFVCVDLIGTTNKINSVYFCFYVMFVFVR